MKVIALKIGGIGVFSDSVEVPIEQLGDARLVAVVGENGAGKTTMLECIPGGVYRTTPSRGSVQQLAHQRDSHIEQVLDIGGKQVTTRILINGTAKTPTTEAYLMDEDGTALTSGKARDYDAKVAEMFPATDVFLSSAFAAQGGEGAFLDLPVCARKALFSRLLGLGHLQELADAAGEKDRGDQLTLERARTELEVVADQAGNVDKLRRLSQEVVHTEERAQERVVLLEQQSAETRKAIEQWHQESSTKHAETVDARSALENARRDAGELQRELERTRSDVAKASGQRAALVQRLADRDEVEAIAGHEQELETRVHQAEKSAAAARKAVTGYNQAVAERNHAVAERRHVRQRIEQVERDVYQDAVRKKERAESDLRASKQRLEHAKEASGGVNAVPCGGDGEFASCTLISAAVRARDSLAELEAQVAETGAMVPATPAPVGDQSHDTDALRDLREVEARINIAPEPAPPEGLQEEERQLATLIQQHNRASAAADQFREMNRVSADLEVIEAELEEAREHGVEFEARMPEHQRRVSDASSLAASAEASERTHQRLKPAAFDEFELRAARTAAGDARTRREQLDRDIEKAEQAAERITELETVIALVTANLDDWQHLQRALGPQGVQALEIDAAGPEVSTLANTLLHACYGSRFTVSLETTRLKADGKGTKEVFELRVIDIERGTEGPADQLSGGEKVLVGEALALAIAVYNTRRSSVPMLDLFRDECAGAHSPKGTPFDTSKCCVKR